jgi:hypothetical protein
MSKEFVKQKERLWNIDPHCENCGVLTVLAKDCGDIKYNETNRTYYFDGPVPDNMATLQHIYCRIHPMRHVRPASGTERRRFLWCYRCNQDYNDKYENPNPKNLKRENKL